MSRQRTGPIFTQEILNGLIQTVQGQASAEQADETVFQEKMQALQRFLHHGMSRFSTESLQLVLDSIVPSQPPSTPGESADDGPLHKMKIKSIKELRDVVKMTMTKREAGSIKASDADALKYMEHFFYAVYCMTEAKRLIDGVFADLYFSYYKPEDQSRQTTVVGSDAVGSNGELSDSHFLEDYSMFGISTLEQLTGSTQHKLRLTVRDMQDVLARWADLLIQGEPDAASFEPESEQDLLLVRTSSRTQPILRLLPDTFAKFYKCIELSKQWWVLAHDIYPHLPFQRHPPEDAEVRPDQKSQSSSVESRDLSPEKADVTSQVVMETKEAIKEINSEIEAVQEELEALSKREEKFTILVETYDKVGQDIEVRTREKQQMLAVRDRLAQSGNKDARVREELEAAEAGVRQLDGMLKLLEFQHSLLLQDYLIHLEIRPSIIRFQGEATLRLKDAQVQLEQQALNLEKLQRERSGSLTSAPNHESTVGSVHSCMSDESLGSVTRLSTPNDTGVDAKPNNFKRQTNRKAITLNETHSGQKVSKPIDIHQDSSTKNCKRHVAFEERGEKKSIATSSPRNSLQQISGKTKEKPQAVNHSSALMKSAKEGQAGDVLNRVKRNSLPVISGPHRQDQPVSRRKSQDESTYSKPNKADTKISPPTVKDSNALTKTNKNTGPAEKPPLFNQRHKVAAGNNKTNPLVKSVSHKDVVHKQQTSEDSKPHRTRSSSDPPAVPKDALVNLKRKSSLPKAPVNKASTDSETATAQRNKLTRPRVNPALKK